MQRGTLIKTVKRSQIPTGWPQIKSCTHVKKISVTTLTVQYMCWPLLTGPIRFETHFYLCNGTGRMSLIRIRIYLYTCKGNITDGRGFEPQRFTGIRSLAPIDTDHHHHHQHQKLCVLVMLVEEDGGDQQLGS